MVASEGFRRAQLGVGAAALVVTVAVSAAAQTSASFPDVPQPEQPSAPAPPPPPPAPVPTAPPVAPPAPAPAAPQPQYPAQGYYYPPAVAPAPAAPEPAYPEAQYGGFAPPVLPFRDDVPTPDGYRLETTRHTGLLTAGVLVLAGSYAVAFGVAAAHGFDKSNGWLIVPVLGPWVALTKRESPCDIDDVAVRDDAEKCVNSALDEAALIAAIAVDGLVQATGAALALGGALSTQRAWVREDIATLRVWPQRVGRAGYGLGLHGRF